MEIELTEEQRLLRDTCREFADRELKPNAKRWDREHKFPAEAVKKAFELGLGGVAVPAEWGGAGMDNVAYVLAIEEISRGCASTNACGMIFKWLMLQHPARVRERRPPPVAARRRVRRVGRRDSRAPQARRRRQRWRGNWARISYCC